MDLTPSSAAVAGLTRSEPRGRGISREATGEGFRYRDPLGQAVTGAETLRRIGVLVIPPGWKDVWISPDPLGHIQATGVDNQGRTQYLYHELWREQRDAQKFAHMLRFAAALPALRTATVRDLSGRHLDRDRVAAGAVRLIDLGLFRIGGEKYAELDHHYGATTLQKRDVRVARDGIVFDYIAKEGRRRTITIADGAIRSTVRALIRSGNDLASLFCFQDGATWRPLHSHEVSGYIAANAGGHFTAKEFRTWNATVLMALFLANVGTVSHPAQLQEHHHRQHPSCSDLARRHSELRTQVLHRPRLISRYESDGRLSAIPAVPAALPAAPEAEVAVAALLAAQH